MENEFKRLLVDSTMMKPSFIAGRTQPVLRPCTIYGIYNERSGTLGLEYVLCDGLIFTNKDIEPEDKEKFFDEMREYILGQDND